MKVLCLLIIFLTSTISASAENGGHYNMFLDLAGKHAEQVHQDALSYMVGGGLGLGLSVALGITSKEPFPKLGYTLIQVLSAAAVAHGASLYFHGDGLTQEEERLRQFAKQMEAARVPVEQRKRILDSTTMETIRAEMVRYRQLRRIRGYLELTSAVTSGLTLGFSKSGGSASGSALGFIILISLVGAYSDLAGSGNAESMHELYSFDIAPVPKGMEFAWSYSW